MKYAFAIGKRKAWNQAHNSKKKSPPLPSLPPEKPIDIHKGVRRFLTYISTVDGPK